MEKNELVKDFGSSRLERIELNRIMSNGRNDHMKNILDSENGDNELMKTSVKWRE
jgi:hypothetical protein